MKCHKCFVLNSRCSRIHMYHDRDWVVWWKIDIILRLESEYRFSFWEERSMFERVRIIGTIRAGRVAASNLSVWHRRLSMKSGRLNERIGIEISGVGLSLIWVGSSADHWTAWRLPVSRSVFSSTVCWTASPNDHEDNERCRLEVGDQSMQIVWPTYYWL